MGFLKGLLIFSAGVYGGIYASQNYDVPKVDDPQALIQKIKDYLSQYEKPSKSDK